ncbi:MAG: hypothetical protein E7609_05845 [Ruminococcaceae bacterium]|nr:hypothetical protein [Oscillospiraceae bacterium]
MLTTFLATLNPMATLFLCIAIGFIARKAKLLPDNAGKVMAKLETRIFCPALAFITMARFFTVETVRDHAINLTLSCIGVGLALGMAIFLARFLRKTICPSGEKKESFFKKLLNAPMVALFLGIIMGITGLGAHLPLAVTNTLDTPKACMGPVAMLLCGFTVAAYSLPHMLKQGRVYIATFLRLFVLPAILIAALWGAKALAGILFRIKIDNTVLFLTFFATAAPLGLNTIIFPEAYGGNPKTGASMALISHTLCILSIPLMYALMTLIFGAPTF